jgi:hypothetical protein
VFVIIFSFTCFQVVNCFLHADLTEEASKLEIRAKRDIEEGEELTLEYGAGFWGDQQPEAGISNKESQDPDMID